MSIKRGSFWLRLGDYLGGNPWEEFLETLQHRALLRRIFFGAILALALYLGSDWATIGFFAGLWAVYEAIFYAVRFLRSRFGQPAD